MKKVEVGHDLNVGPFQLQDGAARRQFYCRKCHKSETLDFYLNVPAVAEYAQKRTLQIVAEFEGQPCA